MHVLFPWQPNGNSFTDLCLTGLEAVNDRILRYEAKEEGNKGEKEIDTRSWEKAHGNGVLRAAGVESFESFLVCCYVKTLLSKRKT